MLAALPKGAGVYSPKINPARALERRNLVLDLMAQNNVVTRAQADAAKRTPIRLAPNHGYSARPQWVIEQARQVLAQRVGPTFGTTGARVWTTLDPAAQNAADSALVRGLARIEREPWFRGPRKGAPAPAPAAGAARPGPTYLQGALVTVDARTGEILAMVGGREWEDSHFNRVTAARRQPGSSFKPLVYAAALESGIPASAVMEDTALRITMRGTPVYSPRNSDGRFRGPITVRDALVESVNTIAVQLGEGLGWNTLPVLAQRFGIKSQVQPYPSSTIGASAVAPIEMAAAYTAFANGGMRVEPMLVRRVADGTGRVVYDARGRGVRTLTPAVAFVATDILRDAAERGTGREARTRLPARVPMAGKTGTTNDGTDVWYVGYTPEMVTAVWVGNDDNSPLKGVQGGGLPARIWRDFMAGALGSPVARTERRAEPKRETPARKKPAEVSLPIEGTGYELGIDMGEQGITLSAQPPADGPRPPVPLPRITISVPAPVHQEEAEPKQ